MRSDSCGSPPGAGQARAGGFLVLVRLQAYSPLPKYLGLSNDEGVDIDRLVECKDTVIPST